MKVVKLLERKEVIRLFGGGLILAPLFNSYLTFLALKSTAALAGGTGFQAYWKVVVAGTMAQHALDISSLVIGCLMLTGLQAAWKLMLALLGGYMIMQVAHLGQNLRHNPLNGLFFIANVGLFLFIADQLAFKQKQKSSMQSAKPRSLPVETPNLVSSPQLRQTSPPSATLTAHSPSLSVSHSSSALASQPPQAKETSVVIVHLQTKPMAKPRLASVRKSKAKIMVHFQGVGAWAQVVSFSASGIELRSSGPAPVNIETREVEMNLAPDLLVKARLKSRSGSLYFFEYTDLAPSRIPKLNQWLLAQAS
jgi:hypothetical protein